MAISGANKSVIYFIAMYANVRKQRTQYADSAHFNQSSHEYYPPSYNYSSREQFLPRQYPHLTLQPTAESRLAADSTLVSPGRDKTMFRQAKAQSFLEKNYLPKKGYQKSSLFAEESTKQSKDIKPTESKEAQKQHSRETPNPQAKDKKNQSLAESKIERAPSKASSTKPNDVTVQKLLAEMKKKDDAYLAIEMKASELQEQIRRMSHLYKTALPHQACKKETQALQQQCSRLQKDCANFKSLAEGLSTRVSQLQLQNQLYAKNLQLMTCEYLKQRKSLATLCFAEVESQSVQPHKLSVLFGNTQICKDSACESFIIQGQDSICRMLEESCQTDAKSHQNGQQVKLLQEIRLTHDRTCQVQRRVREFSLQTQAKVELSIRSTIGQTIVDFRQIQRVCVDQESKTSHGQKEKCSFTCQNQTVTNQAYMQTFHQQTACLGIQTQHLTCTIHSLQGQSKSFNQLYSQTVQSNFSCSNNQSMTEQLQQFTQQSQTSCQFSCSDNQSMTEQLQQFTQQSQTSQRPLKYIRLQHITVCKSTRPKQIVTNFSFTNSKAQKLTFKKTLLQNIIGGQSKQHAPRKHHLVNKLKTLRQRTQSLKKQMLQFKQVPFFRCQPDFQQLKLALCARKQLGLSECVEVTVDAEQQDREIQKEQQLSADGLSETGQTRERRVLEGSRSSLSLGKKSRRLRGKRSQSQERADDHKSEELRQLVGEAAVPVVDKQLVGLVLIVSVAIVLSTVKL